MNANELRIGNYVYDDNGEIVQVEQINSDKIHKFVTVSRGKLIYSSNIYQISLTKELLFKCGFGQQFLSDPQEFNVLSAYKNGGFEILKFNDEEVFFYVDWSGNRTCIKSLHQLQNLYFALNGKELEIKL